MIWFVAPDSYAASNAASSGAFVLSESYLYTQEMLQESLEHLTDDGMVVMQFGEKDYDLAPNRTARLAATARKRTTARGSPVRRPHRGGHHVDGGDSSTAVRRR